MLKQHDLPGVVNSQKGRKGYSFQSLGGGISYFFFQFIRREAQIEAIFRSNYPKWYSKNSQNPELFRNILEGQIPFRN